MMLFNFLIGIAEHPGRADKSAPTDCGSNSDVPLSVKGAPHSSSLVRGFCPHGYR